jgi:diacylglycerol kinase family enzyme
MYCFRTSKVEITSAEPLPWTLDGEYGGTHTKVVIENICRGIDIRVEQKES